MIISCIKCFTKYRFDDSLMEGNGVWVRCSRCRELFFQENPAKKELREASVVAADMDVLSPEPGRDSDSPDFDKKLDAGTSREEIDVFLAKIEETKKTLEENDDTETLVRIGKEVRKEAEPETGGIGSVAKPTGAVYEQSEPGTSEFAGPSVKTEKRGFWSPWRILALILFINLLFGGIYLWFFPGTSGRFVRDLSTTVPYVGGLLGSGEKSGDFHLNQIRLEDVRQRHVSNLMAGKLRVIEGVAVNSSPWPITRMQVKGELYDSNGAMIADRFAYAGNLLSDDELATLSEEALQKELDLPMGSDAQNIRIEPKGQIPFMIIFAHEPPDIVKAMVSPAGGEKLLQ